MSYIFNPFLSNPQASEGHFSNMESSMSTDSYISQVSKIKLFFFPSLFKFFVPFTKYTTTIL